MSIDLLVAADLRDVFAKGPLKRGISGARLKRFEHSQTPNGHVHEDYDTEVLLFNHSGHYQ